VERGGGGGSNRAGSEGTRSTTRSGAQWPRGAAATPTAGDRLCLGSCPHAEPHRDRLHEPASTQHRAPWAWYCVAGVRRRRCAVNAPHLFWYSCCAYTRLPAMDRLMPAKFIQEKLEATVAAAAAAAGAGRPTTTVSTTASARDITACQMCACGSQPGHPPCWELVQHGTAAGCSVWVGSKPGGRHAHVVTTQAQDGKVRGENVLQAAHHRCRQRGVDLPGCTTVITGGKTNIQRWNWRGAPSHMRTYKQAAHTRKRKSHTWVHRYVEYCRMTPMMPARAKQIRNPTSDHRSYSDTWVSCKRTGKSVCVCGGGVVGGNGQGVRRGSLAVVAC
jgi:hypothetical protein